MQLDGRAAIVTGAGTGVGRATALALARGGCSVLVNYSRSREDAERTAADAAALGVRALAVRADVARDDDCRALADAARRELGRLDVLVNNAGATVFVPHPELERVAEEDWDRIFGVNVRGAFQCARAARALLEESGGEIVNVSSVAALSGVGSSIPYCASKAALNSLTVTLARALAPKIRVNAVAPGFIEGRWLAEGLGPALYEAVRRANVQRSPLQRVCTPDDVAAAILSVITGPDLVTGTVLPIEAGILIAG